MHDQHTEELREEWGNSGLRPGHDMGEIAEFWLDRTIPKKAVVDKLTPIP